MALLAIIKKYTPSPEPNKNPNFSKCASPPSVNAMTNNTLATAAAANLGFLYRNRVLNIRDMARRNAEILSCASDYVWRGLNRFIRLRQHRSLRGRVDGATNVGLHHRQVRVRR